MFEDDIIAKKVHAFADIPYRTRDEIVQYYQQEHGEGWKAAMSKALAPFTSGKNGQPQKHASIMRRFQSRGAKSFESIKPSKKAEKEYEALGKILPPKDYKMPFSVTVSGEARISKNCRAMTFTVNIGAPGAFSLQGGNAEQFVRNPSVDDLLTAYFEGDEDNPVEGWCSGPSISIAS